MYTGSLDSKNVKEEKTLEVLMWMKWYSKN